MLDTPCSRYDSHSRCRVHVLLLTVEAAESTYILATKLEAVAKPAFSPKINIINIL